MLFHVHGISDIPSSPASIIQYHISQGSHGLTHGISCFRVEGTKGTKVFQMCHYTGYRLRSIRVGNGLRYIPFVVIRCHNILRVQNVILREFNSCKYRRTIRIQMNLIGCFSATCCTLLDNLCYIFL